MALELAVTVGTTAEALAASLGEFARDQLPFATALALTRTAWDATKAAQKHLPTVFTTRGDRLARTFRAGRAQKSDWPNISVPVGTLAEAMVLHETGGVKRARSQDGIGIPTRLIRPSKGTKITKAKRPKRLLQKPGVRKADETIRRSKTSGRDRREIFYLLRPSVRIKKRLGFQGVVSEAFERAYPGRFVAAMNEALASKKSRAERALEKARMGGGTRGGAQRP